MFFFGTPEQITSGPDSARRPPIEYPWSSRLVGESQLDPTSLYTRQLQRMATSILNDDSDPLHSEFQVLPSGRRFLIPRCKTKRHKNNFVPAVLTVLDKL